MFWLFIAASVGVFTMYILVHLCCILKGRVLCIEYEQARRSVLSFFQDPEAARTTFGEANSTNTTTDVAFAGIAATVAAAAVALISTVEINTGLSTSLIISSVLACACLGLSVRYINKATQFTVVQVPLNDPRRYLNDLLDMAFVGRKIGYRLLFFCLPLAVGWVPAVGGPLMFVAVLILVSIYVISDVRSHAAVSHTNQDTDLDTFSEHSPQREYQGAFSLGPLERENPTRLPRQAQQFRHWRSSLV